MVSSLQFLSCLPRLVGIIFCALNKKKWYGLSSSLVNWTSVNILNCKLFYIPFAFQYPLTIQLCLSNLFTQMRICTLLMSMIICYR